jgi:hypothetical protein
MNGMANSWLVGKSHLLKQRDLRGGELRVLMLGRVDTHPISAVDALPSAPPCTVVIFGAAGDSPAASSFRFALNVTTPKPLHCDSDCTDTPQRFDAGELLASGTFDERSGAVRVRWSACGQDPQIDFVED